MDNKSEEDIQSKIVAEFIKAIETVVDKEIQERIPKLKEQIKAELIEEFKALQEKSENEMFTSWERSHLNNFPNFPNFLEPTPEMLEMPEFKAIWQCIKSWDINVPEQYEGYMGATGNHVRAILDALAKVKSDRK